MKEFTNPKVEVVRFSMKDVIVTSTPCDCVECPECFEGDNCRAVDFG